MANILLVDDDPVLLKLYSTRLSADGHTVQTAANGEVAIELLKTFTPHIMVLDLLMPKLNGFSFLETINKDVRFQTSVRIVFSSVANEDQKERLEQLGVIRFLNKTETTPTQLVEVVNQYLPRSSP